VGDILSPVVFPEPKENTIEETEMKDKIHAILAKEGKLAVDAATLGDDDDLYAAGLTSFASVQLMLALEDGFDVEFSEKMLGRRTFQSISSIAAALTELQA
jgi:acyl carrier protein